MTIEPSASRKPKQRFDLVDIARFLCAFWVMLYHYVYTYAAAQNGLDVPAALVTLSRYGYMGVDFFFIISGFVIAFSSEGKTAAQFFESRFFRIWPTFVICMTATAIILHLFGDRQATAIDYLANLTVVPAYLGIKPFDGVYWTLAYEIFFYSIVFALVLFRVRDFQRHIMVFGSILMLALSPVMLNETSYLALFIIGIAFQSLSAGKIQRRIAIPAIAAMSILAIVGANSRAIDLGFSGPVAAAVLTGLIALFALLTLAKWAQIGIGWARTLGLITYPLYLLHSKIGTTSLDAIETSGNWPVAIGLMMAAMVLASYAISKFDLKIIQSPVRIRYRQIMADSIGKKHHAQ